MQKIILGLGTNLGDRFENLRRALSLIKAQLKIEKISPVYQSDALLPENAPASWNQKYLNIAILCETNFSPYELLSKLQEIEKKVGRTQEEKWGPRIVDIDILAWENLELNDENLKLPHPELLNRPFALWPLADIAPLWIFKNKTAKEFAKQLQPTLQTKKLPHRLDTSLVGIVNITPDSFSDGGNFLNINAAVEHAKHLVATGAEVIDLGAEASSPNAKSISPDVEWQRLESILSAITKTDFVITPKISIDTRHIHVAEKALALGANWINDVSGLEDPAMCELVAAKNCHVIFMHHLGIPTNEKVLPLDKNPAELVLQWAEQRLEELAKYHISHNKLIFDVGIGYGKTNEQSYELIKQIDVFKKLNLKLMVGHSRKRFLSLFTDKPFAERDEATLEISKMLIQKRVDYLRVHNTEMHEHLREGCYSPPFAMA